MLSWSMALGRLSGQLDGAKIFLNCNPYLIELIDIDKVKQLFRQNDIILENVIMEITERSAITDFKLFYEKLSSYRECGFGFAVDDVGGGYASLESIVEVRPEIVKIDRHIVSGCAEDSFKASVIKFVVGLCKDNGIVSVAEGIESKEDLNAVKKLGVDACQGYYLCRPTAIFDFQKFCSIKC